MIPFVIMAIEDPDDRRFMEGLYLDHRRLIYSEVYKILQNQWATEDVLQTVLEKLIDKIPLLKTFTRAVLVNYIISASKHTALNYLRDNRKVVQFCYDDEMDSESTHWNLMENPIQTWEDSQHIRELWKRLDEKHRYVLEMKYFLQKNDAEIAKELGINPGSVRMTLTRARNKFKELLNGELAER